MLSQEVVALGRCVLPLKKARDEVFKCLLPGTFNVS